MKWNKIEKSTWSRSDYYDHYHSHVPCSYSMTANLDISALRERKLKLYPTMLFVLSKVVNCHEEFRTAINSHGELGFYDVVFPSYTIFHQQTETFSNIWTEYCGDYQEFLKRYQEDITCYGDREGFIAKPNMPENVFTVSMIPWVTFESFHLHLPKSNDYLLPIFTMGRFFSQQHHTYLPLALQVHHAVCDGFHVGRFVNEVQELLHSLYDLSL